MRREAPHGLQWGVDPAFFDGAADAQSAFEFRVHCLNAELRMLADDPGSHRLDRLFKQLKTDGELLTGSLAAGCEDFISKDGIRD